MRRKSNRLVVGTVLTFAGLLTTSAAMATPNLTSADPPWFVQGMGQTTLMMTGTGLVLPTTTGYTIDQDVTVFANWQGGPWTELTASRNIPPMWTGWSPETLGLTVLIDGPGEIGVMSCLVGQGCSLPYYVQVKPTYTALPVLQSTVVQVPVGGNGQPQWIARENVNGDGHDLMWVGSVSASIMGEPASSMGYFWAPTSTLSTAGASFPLRIQTDAGFSNTGTMEVWGEPQGSAWPDTIDVTADTTVTLTFPTEFSVPTESLKVQSSTCDDLVNITMTSTTTGTVVIPAACLSSPGTVSLYATNFVGTGTMEVTRSCASCGGGVTGSGGGGGGSTGGSGTVGKKPALM